MSWVIRDRVTGAAVAETFNSEYAMLINLHSANLEAVPALQHLQELNTEGTKARNCMVQAGRRIH